MKTKDVIKISVPILVAIILSILSYHYLLALFSDFEISSDSNNQIEPSSQYRLYFQCLALFFALIPSPFILSVFKDTWRISKNSIGKIVVILEIAGVLLAYLTTPPDLISTIIVVIVWQVPVIVNLVALFIITKE